MNSSNAQEIIPEVAECWERGELSYKYRPVQDRMRAAWIKSKAFSKEFVLHVSRQTGKSFFLTSLASEACLKNPGIKVIYVAPVKEKLKDFISKILETLLDDAPENVRPELVGTTLVFKNDSVITFYGAVNESYKHIRGSAAYMVIIDEAGFMDSLEQIMGMIRPVLLRSQGYLILSSSSPETADHPFCEYIQKAQLQGWYFLSTINDDETITREMFESEAKKCAPKGSLNPVADGIKTTAFRREYLCEILTETERALVPEWKDEYVQDLKPTEFWPYYQTYLGMDI